MIRLRPSHSLLFYILCYNLVQTLGTSQYYDSCRQLWSGGYPGPVQIPIQPCTFIQPCGLLNQEVRNQQSCRIVTIVGFDVEIYQIINAIESYGISDNVLTIVYLIKDGVYYYLRSIVTSYEVLDIVLKKYSHYISVNNNNIQKYSNLNSCWYTCNTIIIPSRDAADFGNTMQRYKYYNNYVYNYGTYGSGYQSNSACKSGSVAINKESGKTDEKSIITRYNDQLICSPMTISNGNNLGTENFNNNNKINTLNPILNSDTNKDVQYNNNELQNENVAQENILKINFEPLSTGSNAKEICKLNILNNYHNVLSTSSVISKDAKEINILNNNHDFKINSEFHPYVENTLSDDTNKPTQSKIWKWRPCSNTANTPSGHIIYTKPLIYYDSYLKSTPVEKLSKYTLHETWLNYLNRYIPSYTRENEANYKNYIDSGICLASPKIPLENPQFIPNSYNSEVRRNQYQIKPSDIHNGNDMFAINHSSECIDFEPICGTKTTMNKNVGWVPLNLKVQVGEGISNTNQSPNSFLSIALNNDIPKWKDSESTQINTNAFISAAIRNPKVIGTQNGNSNIKLGVSKTDLNLTPEDQELFESVINSNCQKGFQDTSLYSIGAQTSLDLSNYLPNSDKFNFAQIPTDSQIKSLNENKLELDFANTINPINQKHANSNIEQMRKIVETYQKPEQFLITHSNASPGGITAFPKETLLHKYKTEHANEVITNPTFEVSQVDSGTLNNYGKEITVDSKYNTPDTIGKNNLFNVCNVFKIQPSTRLFSGTNKHIDNSSKLETLKENFIQPKEIIYNGPSAPGISSLYSSNIKPQISELQQPSLPEDSYFKVVSYAGNEIPGRPNSSSLVENVEIDRPLLEEQGDLIQNLVDNQGNAAPGISNSSPSVNVEIARAPMKEQGDLIQSYIDFKGTAVPGTSNSYPSTANVEIARPPLEEQRDLIKSFVDYKGTAVPGISNSYPSTANVEIATATLKEQGDLIQNYIDYEGTAVPGISNAYSSIANVETARPSPEEQGDLIQSYIDYKGTVVPGISNSNPSTANVEIARPPLEKQRDLIQNHVDDEEISVPGISNSYPYTANVEIAKSPLEERGDLIQNYIDYKGTAVPGTSNSYPSIANVETARPSSEEQGDLIQSHVDYKGTAIPGISNSYPSTANVEIASPPLEEQRDLIQNHVDDEEITVPQISNSKPYTANVEIAKPPLEERGDLIQNYIDFKRTAVPGTPNSYPSIANVGTARPSPEEQGHLIQSFIDYKGTAVPGISNSYPSIANFAIARPLEEQRDLTQSFVDYKGTAVPGIPKSSPSTANVEIAKPPLEEQGDLIQNYTDYKGTAVPGTSNSYPSIANPQISELQQPSLPENSYFKDVTYAGNEIPGRPNSNSPVENVEIVRPLLEEQGILIQSFVDYQGNAAPGISNSYSSIANVEIAGSPPKKEGGLLPNCVKNEPSFIPGDFKAYSSKANVVIARLPSKESNEFVQSYVDFSSTAAPGKSISYSSKTDVGIAKPTPTEQNDLTQNCIDYKATAVPGITTSYASKTNVGIALPPLKDQDDLIQNYISYDATAKPGISTTFTSKSNIEIATPPPKKTDDLINSYINYEGTATPKISTSHPSNVKVDIATQPPKEQNDIISSYIHHEGTATPGIPTSHPSNVKLEIATQPPKEQDNLINTYVNNEASTASGISTSFSAKADTEIAKSTLKRQDFSVIQNNIDYRDTAVPGTSPSYSSQSNVEIATQPPNEQDNFIYGSYNDYKGTAVPVISTSYSPKINEEIATPPAKEQDDLIHIYTNYEATARPGISSTYSPEVSVEIVTPQPKEQNDLIHSYIEYKGTAVPGISTSYSPTIDEGIAEPPPKEQDDLIHIYTNYEATAGPGISRTYSPQVDVEISAPPPKERDDLINSYIDYIGTASPGNSTFYPSKYTEIAKTPITEPNDLTNSFVSYKDTGLPGISNMTPYKINVEIATPTRGKDIGIVTSYKGSTENVLSPFLYNANTDAKEENDLKQNFISYSTSGVTDTTIPYIIEEKSETNAANIITNNVAAINSGRNNVNPSQVLYSNLDKNQIERPINNFLSYKASNKDNMNLYPNGQFYSKLSNVPMFDNEQSDFKNVAFSTGLSAESSNSISETTPDCISQFSLLKSSSNMSPKLQCGSILSTSSPLFKFKKDNLNSSPMSSVSPSLSSSGIPHWKSCLSQNAAYLSNLIPSSCGFINKCMSFSPSNKKTSYCGPYRNGYKNKWLDKYCKPCLPHVNNGNCFGNAISDLNNYIHDMRKNDGKIEVNLGNAYIMNHTPISDENTFLIPTEDPNIKIKGWNSELRIVKTKLIIETSTYKVNNFVPIIQNNVNYDTSKLENIAKNAIEKLYGEPVVIKGVGQMCSYKPYVVVCNIDETKLRTSGSVLWLSH